MPPTTYQKLLNKHVLVIGVSSGLGAGVAEASLEPGAFVTIASSQSIIDATINRLRELYLEFDSKIQRIAVDLSASSSSSSQHSGAEAEAEAEADTDSDTALEQKLHHLFVTTPTLHSSCSESGISNPNPKKVNHVILTAADPLSVHPLSSPSGLTSSTISTATHFRLTLPLLLAKVSLQHLPASTTSSLTLTSGTLAKKPSPGWALLSYFAGGLISLTKALALEMKPVKGSTAARTYLAFHHNAKLYKLSTVVSAIKPFSALEEANKLLFKKGKDDESKSSDDEFAIVAEKTIFHPQGGGQPSDEGVMTKCNDSVFRVSMVRMDAVNDGQVLHFGRFDSSSSANKFQVGDTIEQSIDIDKRLLYSRLHTAGHVLGAAVRLLLEKEIPGFDELKASHFPDIAGCEFQGSIEGKWKEPIQQKVDEYIDKAMPVEVDFWDEEDFRKNGLERLIPDRSLAPPGEKFRVVKIAGAEVYPCGGTHVDTTDLCGKTTVKKISRSKGTSRVSYNVD
ncbi:hypothetical protein B0T09DRAFT_378199 [Sordaria sp. MPI-SDFR-AT-0083]|nr:hypothetical protein B0T09DRAFT_378199 [Sordaria sp. MPI-SDFR-AT-0083]